MHRQRVLSALLLIPPFLALVHYGSPLHFSLLVSLAVGLVAWEFSRLCPAGTAAGLSLLSVAGALAWHAAVVRGMGAGVVAGLLAAAGLTWALVGGEDLKVATLRGAWAVLGAFYAGGLLGAASLVRALPEGEGLIYYLAATTWAADIGAYYVGRSFGRRPLAPRVSPRKTVEGALGGVVAAALVAAAGSGWAWRLPWAPAAGAAAALALVGMLGDLAESAVKRAAGVKDSGALIPGHGGVLDRLDSLVFATPALYGLAWLGWL
ncbi:MAG: phosphatidate cytidylyltransferase [Candidatus Methylomirabilales bacterium]